MLVDAADATSSGASGDSNAILRALVEAYSRLFYHFESAPLMIVNTEHLNPIEREEDFALLIRQLSEMRGRREFFSRGQ